MGSKNNNFYRRLKDSVRHPARDGGCMLKIRGTYPALTTSGRKVADYIFGNTSGAIRSSIVDMARHSGVSIGSVGQFCRAVGFSGFSDFRIALAQDIASHSLDICESISSKDDLSTIIDKVFSINVQSLYDTRDIVDNDSLILAARWLAKARRVCFYGVGGSAVIALDGQLYFSHLGIITQAINDVAVQITSASTLTKHDVAVGISQSGRTKGVLDALSVAKESGAKTIGITNYRKSAITKIADVCLYTSFGREGNGLKSASISSRVAQMVIIETLYVMAAKMKGKGNEQLRNRIDKKTEEKVRK